jgi:recombination protein U
MTFKYPRGIQQPLPKKTKTILKTNTTFKNRGMGLEEELNLSNAFYNDEGIALIQKRPTPINVVKVDYSKGAKITQAYFEKQSTTDYNGVYRGKYLDFEAKSTVSKTSLPISNITTHQINHLKNVIDHGGVAFFIIAFESLQQTYLLPAKDLLSFLNKKERQSLPINWIQTHAQVIEMGYKPRLHYLKAVDQLFF